MRDDILGDNSQTIIPTHNSQKIIPTQNSQGFSFLTFLCALFSGSGDFTRIFFSKRDRASPPPFFTRARDIIWGKHYAKGWIYSARFSTLYPSIHFTSLSLSISLSLSLPLYISPSTFLSLSFLLSLFSSSFSLAYLMDVFVLVFLEFPIFFV